jgi:hypothetical protein
MNETIQRLGEDIASEVIQYIDGHYRGMWDRAEVSAKQVLHAVIVQAVTRRVFVTGEQETPSG